MAKPRLGIIGCGQIAEFMPRRSGLRVSIWRLSVRVGFRPGTGIRRPSGNRSCFRFACRPDGGGGQVRCAPDCGQHRRDARRPQDGAPPQLADSRGKAGQPSLGGPGGPRVLVDGSSQVLVATTAASTGRCGRRAPKRQPTLRTWQPCRCRSRFRRRSTLPEDTAYLDRFFANSVHGLDMLRFVFGDVSVEHVHRVKNDGGTLQGFAAILSAPAGSVVQLNANWRAPGELHIYPGPPWPQARALAVRAGCGLRGNGCGAADPGAAHSHLSPERGWADSGRGAGPRF